MRKAEAKQEGVKTNAMKNVKQSSEEEKVKKLERELKQMKDNYEKLKNECDEYREQLKDYTALVKGQNDEIAELKNECDEYREQLKDYTALVKGQNDEIAELKNEYDEQLQCHDIIVDAKNNRIVELVEQRKVLREQLGDVSAQLTAVTQQRDTAQETIEHLHPIEEGETNIVVVMEDTPLKLTYLRQQRCSIDQAIFDHIAANPGSTAIRRHSVLHGNCFFHHTVARAIKEGVICEENKHYITITLNNEGDKAALLAITDDEARFVAL